MSHLLRRIQYLLRRNRVEAELNEEMEFHRQMLLDDHAGDRAAASREWGNATLAREDARAVWIGPWLASFWQDLTYGIRGMRREPGFTLTAVGALAVAIGLNTSLFTVFNSLALRPWPVKDPAHVVNVTRVIHKGALDGFSGFGVAEWRYLTVHSKAFTGLVLSNNGEPVKVDERPLSLTWVSGNYFSVLGVDMARGRAFLPEEDRPQAPEAVAVLNYGTWQNRYGGDPGIVGKTVRVDGVLFSVVGVTPENFNGTDMNRADLWAPFSAKQVLRPHDADVLPFLTDLKHCCVSMAGRLAPGYTREQGAAETELLMGQLHGKSEHENGSAVIAMGTALIEAALRNNKAKIVPAFAAMFGAVTLVLLLACANVGNLLLARAASRRTEIAVRLSLGGSRGRVIRQLLVESFVLAAAAAAVGLAIAWTAPAALVARMIPENAMAIGPDWLVCAYTAGVAVLACVAFGLAPALHGTGGRIASALKKEGVAGAARLPLRSVLLAAQVAISVILLASAGVLVHGLQRAQHQDPGFRLDRTTFAVIDLPAAAYSGARAREFTKQFQDALAEADGLPATGIANDTPMGNSHTFTSLRHSGERAEQDHLVQMHDISGGYFEVLGIPVLMGRNFTREDTGRKVVLVNETAAHRFWGAENPVGKPVNAGGDAGEVIGVVKDAYTTDLNSIQPTVYFPITGRFGIPRLLVADFNPEARDRITAILHELEPKGRITFTPLAENFRSSLETARYAASLAGAMGMLALVLAAIGMSGVFAYVVRQRTREIGIRMALGADAGQVVRLVLSSNLRALGWGLAAGLAGAFGAATVLKSLFAGITPIDPVALAGVFALLIAAAAAASAFPARRAARVDPLTALRWE